MDLAPCRDCQNEVSHSAAMCPQCGAPRPYDQTWNGYGYEYKSKTKIFGLPLIHISFKYRANRTPVVANGVIAIGQFGYGVITISQFGVGLFSLCQFSISVFTISQITMAAYAICQIGLVHEGIGQVIVPLAEWI